MTDPHDAIGVATPRGGFRWLAGRAGRKEYWTSVALLFAVSWILRYAPPIVSLVISVVFMFVQIRRAHDLGRSGWWGAAVTLLPMLAVVPLFYFAGERSGSPSASSLRSS